MDRGRLKRACIGLLLVAASVVCAAQGVDPQPVPVQAQAGSGRGKGADWYVQLDNDVMFDTDRWYTSGVRIARVANDIEWGITQEIYTPDVQHGPPGAPDRAPTARLLATVDQHFRGEFAYQTVGLALGIRGPSALGEQTQRAVHKVVTSGAIIDWTRQLPDEYDASVAWTRTQRSARESPFGEGLKLHFGAVLGNQELFAHLGAEIRIGDASARGLSSRLLRFAPTPPLTDGGERALGWSAFAGASVRGVGRNELLVTDYDPLKPELELKRAVGRAVVGATYGGRWGSVELNIAADTEEFKGQHTGQPFGSLTLHFAF
ncbi:MAG TPA: lipid A-modifier LpxR family protein [Usitatibacter sp.]|nr:lipid A-modifier LpxR family protein [Usitatibacter sp.]